MEADFVFSFPTFFCLVLFFILGGLKILSFPCNCTCRLEETFQVNHLSHWQMVNLLLPSMEPQGKVVVVSSWHGQAWFTHGGVPAPLDGATFGMFRAYGDSKLANIQFAYELSKRNPRLRVASVHPGMIHTPLGTSRDDSMLASLERWGSAAFWSLLSPVTKSVAQGAATQIYALLDASGNTGVPFLLDLAPHPPTADGHNPEFTAALWKLSEQLVKEALKN